MSIEIIKVSSSILPIVIILLMIGLGILVFFRTKPKSQQDSAELMPKASLWENRFDAITQGQNQLRSDLLQEFKSNREEINNTAKSNRAELSNSFKDLKQELSGAIEKFSYANKETIEKLNGAMSSSLDKLGEKQSEDADKARTQLKQSLKEFQESFDKSVKSFNDLQREKFSELELKQHKLVESTEKRLDQMRETVDEKLQKTLNERLGQSFEQVGKQLESVQKGLGEMQTLAQDVGGLKRVLSNVKMRGGIGEVQLAMLLENILAPDQYESNVKTKKGSDALVEFAIKLPGKDESKKHIWLPIDAKFPKDAYEQLQNAFDEADPKAMEAAQKNLNNAIKKMAKDISEKYLDPPNTTDFGIMFLPFEGIYAEVVRKAALLEEIQRDYRVLITGPNTLAAILNSLQMGFKTLAIEKRSSEVWKVLGAVKTEFDKFGGLLEKAQKNIQTGLNQLDSVSGTRTLAIQRRLRTVESLDEAGTRLILPTIAGDEVDDDENGDD